MTPPPPSPVKGGRRNGDSGSFGSRTSERPNRTYTRGRRNGDSGSFGSRTSERPNRTHTRRETERDSGSFGSRVFGEPHPSLHRGGAGGGVVLDKAATVPHTHTPQGYGRNQIR